MPLAAAAAAAVEDQPGTCPAQQPLGGRQQGGQNSRQREALEDSPRIVRQLLCRLQVQPLGTR